jgi:hypothetical protein
LLLLAVLSCFLGCGKAEASRPVVVLASGDTAGWIIPCGCTSKQSGGLLRRATLVEQARVENEVVLVDVGGAAAGTSPYQRAKFEAILVGEEDMDIAAHNLGASELALGAEYLAGLPDDLKAPLLSTNARPAEGEFALPTRHMVAVHDGRTLAILGVVSESFAAGGWRIDEPRQAVLQEIKALPSGCDSIIVLAYLPEDELRELASSLPEVDLLVGGPTGQTIAPHKVGPTLVTSVTNKGKFLARLSRAFSDTQSSHWKGEIIEVDDSLADHPRQEIALGSFHRHLAREDFTAEQSGLASSIEGAAFAGRIAGTQACLECHDEDGHAWAESGHAHGWETLQATGSHVDSYCQQCHVTGFGAAGGFVSAARSGERTNIGCESCHGPSQAHVENPRVRTPFAARDQCTACHDRENSPAFAYEDYWPTIEHGNAIPAQSASE